MLIEEDLKEQYLNANAITNKEYNYERIKQMADWLLDRVELRPKIAIVCGTGFSNLANEIQDQKMFHYEQIPYFPKCTVPGQAGNLIFGVLNGAPLACMQGHFHGYEGYSAALCAMPMKLFKLLGIETVILTCAAGALNKEYQVGDLMLVKDHIAPLLWTLQSPLIGHNDERFGPRFPAVNRIYTKSLRNCFAQLAVRENLRVKEGVYALFGGPNYETVSDLRSLLVFNTDAIGSTVANEAIVAGYCGLNLLAVALIAYKVETEYDNASHHPNHDEIIQSAQRHSPSAIKVLSEFVKKINASD